MMSSSSAQQQKNIFSTSNKFLRNYKLQNSQWSSVNDIFTKEIQYLGHILSTKGIRPLPSKTQAIQNMHLPKMPK